MENNDFEKQIELRVQQELEKILNNPKAVIAAYQKELANAESLIEILRPKADFYNAVTMSDDWMEMSAAVKLLAVKGFGRNKTFEFLRNRGVFRANNEPYQDYVDREYFKVVEQVFKIPGSYDTMINRKTVVSQKGLDFLRKIIKEG